MANLNIVRRSLGRVFSEPLIRLLSRTKISPNVLSWTGFLLAVAGGTLIAADNLIVAGVVILVGALFDMLDGGLARLTGRVTRFGGILDSVLDRLSEAVQFGGMVVLFLYSPIPHYAFLGKELAVVLLFLVLASSQVVSYIRARAEAAGITCQEGVFTRTERVLVMTLGLFLDQLAIALLIIGLFSLITIVQRLYVSYRS